MLMNSEREHIVLITLSDAGALPMPAAAVCGQNANGSLPCRSRAARTSPCVPAI